jgi:hypothetical protein
LQAIPGYQSSEMLSPPPGLPSFST